MSRLHDYQTAAQRHGTVLIAINKRHPVNIVGAMTKHELEWNVANSLVDELRKLGATARATNVRGSGFARAVVFVGSVSFERGDQL